MENKQNIGDAGFLMSNYRQDNCLTSRRCRNRFQEKSDRCASSSREHRLGIILVIRLLRLSIGAQYKTIRKKYNSEILRKKSEFLEAK